MKSPTNYLPDLDYKFRAGLLAGVLVVVLLGQPASLSASPAAELRHFFKQIDRSLCHLNHCVHGKRHRAASPKSPGVTEPSHDNAAVPAQEEKKVSKPEPKLDAAPDPVKSSTSETLSRSPPQSPVPLPKPRPDNLATPNQSVPQPAINAEPTPKPSTPLKTEHPAPIPAPVQSEPPPVPKLPPAPPAPPPIVVMPPNIPPAPHPMPDNTLTGEACYSSLSKMGVKFDRVAGPVVSGSCSVSDPVKVSGLTLVDVSLKLPDNPTLTCGFALRFASWLEEQAAPITQSHLQSKIASVGTGPGYQCRGRNGDITAKLSEHAFGNAVDIERIHLVDGQVIEVSNAIDTSSKYQPTLAALRAAGCQYFMTVLGPGANSAHASHFHFDLERRGRKGDNRLCE